MKHLKLFEDFEESKKPSFFQRAYKGTKQFLGIESKEDRELIEKIHRAISRKFTGGYDFDFVKNVREIKDGVIVAQVLYKSLVVDLNDNTIMYDGKQLELKNMSKECQELYDALRGNLRFRE